MSARTGWFADCGGRDDEEWMRNMWQPCLQFDGMVTSFDIWHNTEAECERFIREQIIPNAGHMIDEETA